MARNQNRSDSHGGQRSNNPYDPLPGKYKLDSFYTDSGALKKEIYQDVSKGIADFFKQHDITASSIRRFYETIRSVHESVQQNPDMSEDAILEKVKRLEPFVTYNQERDVTKQCFTDFMLHYIDLVENDIKNLKGFKELFMSVIGYSKK